MILFDLPGWIVYSYLFVLGCMLGSFLNVCIYRLPRHERLRDQLTGLWSPRSACPRCRHQIAWYDNIPIISWLRLKGRCRNCRMWISLRYPAIELLNGVLLVLVYWMEVPAGYGAPLTDSSLYSVLGPQMVSGAQSMSPEAWLNWRFLYHVVLIEALIVATFIDIDLWIIPDGATLPAMLVGVLGSFLGGQLFIVPVWFQRPRLLEDTATLMELWLGISPLPGWMRALLDDPEVLAWIAEHPHLHGLAVSLAGLLVGGGLVWLVRIVGERILKREAMGFGDVILMAMIGSFIGWQPVVVVFFLAPAVALLFVGVSVITQRRGEFPYGPYLSLATLIVLLGWKWIWPWVQHYFELGVLNLLLAMLMGAGFVLCLLFVQLMKRLFGIDLGVTDSQVPWTAADQNQFLSSERVDSEQGQWHRPQWPGILSSRGQRQESNWRGPPSG